MKCQNLHHLPVYWAWSEIMNEEARQHQTTPEPGAEPEPKKKPPKPIGPASGIILDRTPVTDPVGLEGLNPEGDPIYRPN